MRVVINLRLGGRLAVLLELAEADRAVKDVAVGGGERVEPRLLLLLQRAHDASGDGGLTAHGGGCGARDGLQAAELS